MLLSASEASNYADNFSSEITVIVGGGAVGLYLANLLAMKNKPVLLLEAGDASLDYFSDGSYSNVGHAHNGIRIGRAKSLGGTTCLWGGQLVEFTQRDFQPTSDMPAWPVSYETMRQLYGEVYVDLGFTVEECSDRMVLDRIPLAPRLVDPFEVFLTRWLPQPNFAKLYEKTLSSNRLPYMLNATVVGMEFTGSRCCAVNVVDTAGVLTRIACAQVVLATGTIETVRLMANIGSKSVVCPWRENQNLGRYFQDHAAARVGQVEIIDAKAITRFSNILSQGKKYQPKIRLHNETRAVSLCAFFSFDSSISEHLDMLKQFLRALMGQRRLELDTRLPSRLIKLAGHLIPLMFAYAKHSRIYVPGNAKVSLNIQTELLKTNHRSLTLDTAQQDEFGLHPIVLDWQVDGGEADAVVDFVKALGEQLAALGIGRLILEPELANAGVARRNWFLLNLSDTYHHAGGVIMGNDPASSCVDANLRVHETCNVFVAGACTFPSSGYANTTLTALALTRRLAAHLGAQA
jgi:hypothetical protein